MLNFFTNIQNEAEQHSQLSLTEGVKKTCVRRVHSDTDQTLPGDCVNARRKEKLRRSYSENPGDQPRPRSVSFTSPVSCYLYVYCSYEMAISLLENCQC